MGYQHSQYARECSAVKTPSARLVLMVLASAMDAKKHICTWRYATLMHYTKLSQPTLTKALREIEAAGIIIRQNRYKRSNIYVWHPDVAEELRDPVRQEDPEQPTAEEQARIDEDLPEGVKARLNAPPKKRFGREVEDNSEPELPADPTKWCANCDRTGHFAKDCPYRDEPPAVMEVEKEGPRAVYPYDDSKFQAARRAHLQGTLEWMEAEWGKSDLLPNLCEQPEPTRVKPVSRPAPKPVRRYTEYLCDNPYDCQWGDLMKDRCLACGEFYWANQNRRKEWDTRDEREAFIRAAQERALAALAAERQQAAA